MLWRNMIRAGGDYRDQRTDGGGRKAVGGQRLKGGY